MRGVIVSRPVMVVDDDDAIRDVLQSIIELEGFDVMTASDGSEALAQLERTRSPPGLILLDLRMPGMDGRTFRKHQRSRERLSKIPVVVLSGDRDGAEIANELGVEWVAKPIDLAPLVAMVKRFCA